MSKYLFPTILSSNWFSIHWLNLTSNPLFFLCPKPHQRAEKLGRLRHFCALPARWRPHSTRRRRRCRPRSWPNPGPWARQLWGPAWGSPGSRRPGRVTVWKEHIINIWMVIFWIWQVLKKNCSWPIASRRLIFRQVHRFICQAAIKGSKNSWKTS